MQAIDPNVTLLNPHKQRRQRLLSKHGGRCIFCDEPNATTLDHMIPRSRGGTEHDWNLWPCCPTCNNRKASKDWRDFYRAQPYYKPENEALISRYLLD